MPLKIYTLSDSLINLYGRNVYAVLVIDSTHTLVLFYILQTNDVRKYIYYYYNMKLHVYYYYVDG
jgi:hypothetical protein